MSILLRVSFELTTFWFENQVLGLGTTEKSITDEIS